MSPEQIAYESSVRSGRRSAGSAPVTSLAVIGLGYVGLPLSILASSRGFRTIGFDIDEIKVAQLSRREAGFLSEAEQLQFKKERSLQITHQESDLKNLDTYIICVPTPVHEDHLPDLAPLESAARIVGRVMKPGSLVVIESTVSPGVCEEIVLPILENESGLSRDSFGFAHCPERINPGDEHWNVRTIPRVIGGIDALSLSRASDLYKTLTEAKIIPMQNIREAEAVKMVENSFRDINIAFVNELAMSFDRAGIDLVNVLRGASSKPFGFMPHFPGCGVGGHCIPVDPYYLIRYGHANGFEHRFLMTARRINNGMPLYTVRVLSNALSKRHKKIKGARIALLGLAYKANVPDMRESPALVIRDVLRKEGARVRVYDPYVPHQSDVRDLRSALEDTDAVLIATDHDVFRSLTPDIIEAYGIRTVVDGRNCLDKQAFERSTVDYRGIGH